MNTKTSSLAFCVLLQQCLYFVGNECAIDARDNLLDAHDKHGCVFNPMYATRTRPTVLARRRDHATATPHELLQLWHPEFFFA